MEKDVDITNKKEVYGKICKHLLTLRRTCVRMVVVKQIY